jgi:transcriptional regulator with XRE-family HTH domain
LKDTYALFGNHLKKIVKEKYGSVSKFSEIVKLPTSVLYSYFSGENFPKLDRFIKICEVLDKTPSYMLMPLLELKEVDKKFLEIFNRLRNIYEDKELRYFVETMVNGLEIVKIQKERYGDLSTVKIIEDIRELVLKSMRKRK